MILLTLLLELSYNYFIITLGGLYDDESVFHICLSILEREKEDIFDDEEEDLLVKIHIHQESDWSSSFNFEVPASTFDDEEDDQQSTGGGNEENCEDENQDQQSYSLLHKN